MGGMSKIKKPNGIIVGICTLILILIVIHWQTGDPDDYSGVITVPVFFVLLPFTAVLIYRYFVGKKK